MNNITREEALIDLDNLRSLINETHISRDKKYFANEFIVDIEQRIQALENRLNAIRDAVDNDYTFRTPQRCRYISCDKLEKILEEE